MYGECAVEMLRELKNAKWLPVYNEESMRKVTREIETLYTNIDKTLQANRENVGDPTIACGLVVNNQSLLRNKRCALAYLTNRLDRLQDLWWQTGSVMPSEAKDCVSANEAVFFDGYDKLLGEYQSSVGVDLTTDQVAPKDLFVEVRVMKEYGEIQFDSGVVNLDLNSVHYLRRSECDLLIRQGVLALTSST